MFDICHVMENAGRESHAPENRASSSKGSMSVATWSAAF